MAQQVQELIDKIQKEGVEQAQARARAIEVEAQKRADAILSKARQDAEKLMAEAEAQSRKKEEAMRLALRQASRDTLLSVRSEIQRILKNIITVAVQKELKPGALAAMVGQIGREASGEMVVRMSPDDVRRVQEEFVAKLQDQVKQKIVFEPRDDIRAGLSVSFDAGKTIFDFTDENLADYMAGLVNQELAAILAGSVPPKSQK